VSVAPLREESGAIPGATVRIVNVKTRGASKRSGMTVDEFVKARILPEYRGIVKALRRLMRTHAPAAQEMISYGIPAYKCKRIITVISPTVLNVWDAPRAGRHRYS
jgi:hypothetical protein